MSRSVNDLDRRLRRAWRWTLVLSLGFVAVLAFVQIRHRAAMTGFRQLQQQGTPAYRAAVERFEAEARADSDLLHTGDATTGRRRNRTRDELARSLFAGRTPTTIPSGLLFGGDVGWIDETRGLALFFTFDRASREMISYSLGPLPAIPPRDPWLIRALRDVDPLRRMWVGSFTAFMIGPMLWIGLFVATIVWRSARLPLAHAQLAVAWLCFLGWLLHPNYSIFWGMFSNDMLFWGVLMVIASWIALWIARDSLAAAADDSTRCRACGYDLTGNVSGVCPECGTATEPRRATKRASA